MTTFLTPACKVLYILHRPKAGAAASPARRGAQRELRGDRGGPRVCVPAAESDITHMRLYLKLFFFSNQTKNTAARGDH